jgi:glutathione S-transferase
MLQVIGSYISPYVRKVLVVLELKGIAYEIDPIVPFYGNEEFSRLSPLRRIPVLLDPEQDIVLNDSTVIVEYLEECYPQVPVYPEGPVARARARWFEEYADSRMGDVFIWQVFNQNIRKFVWGIERDEAVYQQAVEVHAPQILGYLERQLRPEGFLLDALSIADIAVGSFFRNLAFARYEIDRKRWPTVAQFVERVFALEPFRKLAVYEDQSLRVPATEVRAVLMEQTNAPIMARTYGGTRRPVPGPMTKI